MVRLDPYSLSMGHVAVAPAPGGHVGGAGAWAGDRAERPDVVGDQPVPDEDEQDGGGRLAGRPLARAQHAADTGRHRWVPVRVLGLELGSEPATGAQRRSTGDNPKSRRP